MEAFVFVVGGGLLLWWLTQQARQRPYKYMTYRLLTIAWIGWFAWSFQLLFG